MTKTAVKGSRPTKTRRTRSDIGGLRDAIYAVVDEIRPCTVRQAYYQLVSRGAIDKTEAEYKTVVRLLGRMRRERVIPFGWLADNTRFMRKPDTYSSLGDMLELTQETYRRAVWDSQDSYVEIWLEKDALTGVLWPVTSKWDVPLMVTRGYPSISFLHSAAETIESWEKPAWIYYLGDHDPSGVNISQTVEAGLREFTSTAEINFSRIAVTPQQIREFDLPTRPTKKSDSRCKSFEGESVEVDAIAPDELRSLVERRITDHIDHDALERLKTVEEAERKTLADIHDLYGGDA